MTSALQRPPRAGNALIEFMAIIVIAGILAAVILPRYSAQARVVDVEEAEDHIAGLLEAAKTVALNHDTDGDGTGNWPLGSLDGFPLGAETERFTYSICRGAGANGDTPFAIRATGRRGTDVEGHTLTLWVRDLQRPEIESGALTDR